MANKIVDFLLLEVCFRISWAFLVAQLVKNLPVAWETWFDSLIGRSPGEGNGYPLQYSGLDNSVHGVSRVEHN